MKIIIIGNNRAEICDIKPAQQGKVFFQTRGQLYKSYPDAFSKMKIYIEGEQKDSEEVLVFKENSLKPYNAGNIDYSQDTLLAEIDEHKFSQPKSILGSFMFIMKNVNMSWKELAPMVPTIIVAIIVLFAFL